MGFRDLEKIVISIYKNNKLVSRVTAESKDLTDLAWAWKGAISPHQHKQATDETPLDVRVEGGRFVVDQVSNRIAEIERLLKG